MGTEMPERGSKTSTVPVVWAIFGIFSARFPVAIGDQGRNLVISPTRRQSNNQWSSGIAAHPAPKKFRVQKSAGNFSPRLFGITTASSSLIIFQRAKISTRSITHLCWFKWRTFWRKNAAGRSPRGSCSCTTMLRLTGHLQPRRNWPTWASNVLITHPILGFGLVGLPPVPWTEKTIERSPFFVRRGGHCYRGDQVGRTNF